MTPWPATGEYGATASSWQTVMRGQQLAGMMATSSQWV